MCARILVIEDNKANLELMIYLLKAFGHSTIVAFDGQEGIEVVNREAIDLIICDIQLPKLNGYEIARKLKSHPKFWEIPLIAVTAFAMVDDRDKALVAGFDGYISKPLEPEQFVGQVEAFLDPEHRSRAYLQPKHVEEHHVPFRSEPKNITILIVDNTKINLELMQGILEPHGYTVITKLKVHDALEFAHDAPPDLIISDVHMPISGYQFLESVKQDAKLSQIPFIFVSSTMLFEEDSGRAFVMGAHRFLSRPVEPEVLIAEIEACLR